MRGRRGVEEPEGRYCSVERERGFILYKIQEEEKLAGSTDITRRMGMNTTMANGGKEHEGRDGVRAV